MGRREARHVENINSILIPDKEREWVTDRMGKRMSS